MEDIPCKSTELKLSPRETTSLEEFRAAVSSIPDKPNDSDRYYLRWLRARNFNVEKALIMFRNHMDYRARFEADTILTNWTPPEVLTRCFPGGFFGEDKNGHPVWYDCMGNLDFRGLHKSVTKEDILKYKCMHAVLCDKVLDEKSAEKGRYIDTVTSIIDFENLSFRKHYYWPGLETLKEVLSQVEANCPERIEQVFIVKAPGIFPICYNLVKHIFDEKTRKKIFVFGENWKEELLKYIDQDQLPQVYGGTRCEPDPWCTDFINPGCDVPSEYYFINQTDTARDEMQRVIVSRGSSHKITFEVEQVQSILVWEFVSSSYDIGFGVFLLKDDQKHEVVPVSRCNSHVVPQTGKHICNTAGTYVLKFDNSYSWTRTKELFYCIRLELPAKQATSI